MKDKQECPCCFEFWNNCFCNWKQPCPQCWKLFCEWDMYEYRWLKACEQCIDEVEKARNFERQEIIEEETHKTNFAKWLEFSNTTIWKANKQLLKSNIEIAKKESYRLKKYEWRI